MKDTQTTTAVRAYFRAKRKELMALSELPVCKHPGLIGGHREQIYRTYLADLLPRRYSVGRGMVYEMLRRSKEADIVIWDAHSYPSLPLLDHSFFFAESVRAVIECKSNWNLEDFLDVLAKCAAIDDIVPAKEPTLEDAVVSLQDQVAALWHGREYSGALLSKPQIGTAAMFLSGGSSLTPERLLDLVRADHDIDREWPHVLLFLDTGLLVVKEQSGETGEGRLEFFQYGDDALLAFSIALLRLIDDRVVHSEARFFMERYAFQILDFTPCFVHEFSLRRLPVGRRIFG